jgi:hypothetical protein
VCESNPLVPCTWNRYDPVPVLALFTVTKIEVVRFAAGVTGEAGLKPVQVVPAGKSGHVRVTGALKLFREVNEHKRVRAAPVGTVTDESHAIEKSGTVKVTITLEVTVWPSESTTVIVADPAPTTFALKLRDDMWIEEEPPTFTMALLLVKISNGGRPPMIWYGMVSPLSTAIVLGLIAIEEVAGVTVTVAVAVAPASSKTVNVTAVEAETGFGSIVNVFTESVGFGTTAVLLETTPV